MENNYEGIYHQIENLPPTEYTTLTPELLSEILTKKYETPYTKEDLELKYIVWGQSGLDWYNDFIKYLEEYGK